MLTIEYISHGKKGGIADGFAKDAAEMMVYNYKKGIKSHWKICNELIIYHIRILVYKFVIPQEEVKIIMDEVELKWSSCGAFHNHPETEMDRCLMDVFSMRDEYHKKKKLTSAESKV